MVEKIKEFIIIFLFGFNLFSNENVFKKGVDFFNAGNYKEALEEWKKIEKEYKDFRIFYNIGNAYAKLNKIGYAMLYYEKALKLKQDKRIEDNINFLKLKMLDKVEEAPKTPLRRTLEKIYKKLNINNLLYPFSISFLLINLIITFYLLSPLKFPKSLLILSSFLVALFLITGLLIFHFWYMEKNVIYGVMLEEAVPVKSAPMEESIELFIIHEGLKVRVFEEVGNWVRIALSNGMSGFVLKDSLSII